MPASVLQHTYGLQSLNTSISFSFASPVSAGSTICIFVQCNLNSTNPTVSDTVNGNYSNAIPAISLPLSGGYQSCFCFENAAAGSPTITITPTSIDYIVYAAMEIGGVSSSPLDATASGNGYPPPCGPFTTTAANEIIVSWASQTGSDVEFTAPLVFSVLDNASSNGAVMSCYQVVSSIQTAVTINYGNVYGGALLATFKAAASSSVRPLLTLGVGK